jgi:glutathione peroxidase
MESFLKLSLLCAVAASQKSNLYDLSAIDIDGNNVTLSKYAGNVSLVVNVATYWGTTDENYKALSTLQQKYAKSPVMFFLFPCNQFLSQEPNANSVIKSFAEKYLTLGTNVLMFSKSNVNKNVFGKRCTSTDGCTPQSKDCCEANNGIYNYLQGVVPGKCDWNFNKYPIGKNGIPSGKRYGDSVVADTLEKDIDQLLSANLLEI